MSYKNSASPGVHLNSILKNAISFLVTGFFLGCGSVPSKTDTLLIDANPFGAADGCFLLYNLKSEKFEKVIGDERCRRQFPACSTFKVPLAVMAFDSGLLKDENSTYKWNGVVDTREEVNRDHSAKTWMSQSVVWYSQRITPKLGKTKVQKYLNSFEYGNRDLSAGLQTAWLISPASPGPALKISAFEQIDFMKKLWTDKLPASKRSMQLARDLTYLETSSRGAKLHGKTGSNFYDADRKVHLGWFIAHIQSGEKEYLTVVNLSDREPGRADDYGGPRAKEITKALLANLGIW